MSPIIPKIAIWLWYQLHVFEDKKSRLSLNRECQKIHHIINFGPNVPKDNLKSELNTSFSLFVHSYNFVVLTDNSTNHHHLKRRRLPRKVVKIHLCLFALFSVSKATENESNSEVWIKSRISEQQRNKWKSTPPTQSVVPKSQMFQQTIVYIF